MIRPGFRPVEALKLDTMNTTDAELASVPGQPYANIHNPEQSSHKMGTSISRHNQQNITESMTKENDRHSDRQGINLTHVKNDRTWYDATISNWSAVPTEANQLGLPQNNAPYRVRSSVFFERFKKNTGASVRWSCRQKLDATGRGLCATQDQALMLQSITVNIIHFGTS
ncbi:hypothetical protein Tco_1326275 [Tanacetum coccineum]